MYCFKKIIALLFIGASFIGAHSQGFTFRLTGGYAWQPGNNGNIPAPLVNTQMPTLDTLVNMAYASDTGGKPKIVHNSYGHGFNVGLKIGYQINPYVSVELGVAYTSSATISANQLYTLYQPDSTGAIKPTTGYINPNFSTQSQSVVLSPSVTLSYAKPKFKFYPYLRAGLALPVFGLITHNTSINLIGISSAGVSGSPYYLGSQTNTTIETRTAFKPGFSGAIGVVYRVHPFLQLFGEANVQILNLKASKSNYTAWVEDGMDTLKTREISRNTNFHVATLPFSNIGFNVGVQLLLNKKIFTDKDFFEETRLRNKAKRKPKAKTEEAPAPAQPSK